jgi:3-hydroxyacyl-CoA dehydrogenase/enoyl-CoA hydratase/3-hydroxybutyryl-CoA epimerase
MNDTTTMQTLTYRRAENGVVFIAIDVKDRPVNVLTPELHREIGAVAEQLAADDQAIGAVIHSGKDSFMAGGDLNRIVKDYAAKRSPEQAYKESRTFTESLRKLETCGKPVAVAINGTALGGGLELALACHYRVVSDNPDILLGLPEVSLGLIPGGGGTQRLPRLIGLKLATDLIVWSKRLAPADALKLGIVNEIAPQDELLQRAETWVLNGGSPEQPWDRKGFRIPGGSKLNDMSIGGLFQQTTGRISAKFHHNYPAPIAALNALFNGTTVNSMDAALKIETREFAALTMNPVARNMIRTLFINRGKRSKADILSDPQAEPLKQRCVTAYIDQGVGMAEAGINTVLIENVALAAGMEQGPLAMVESDKAKYQDNASLADTAALRQRLMYAQSLAAAELWQQGETDPVKADLVSIFAWGFPSYTGGVLSLVDTLGLPAFVAECDALAEAGHPGFKVSDKLRQLAARQEYVYPPAD